MQVGRDLILQDLESRVNEFVVLDALTHLPFRSPQRQKIFCLLYQKERGGVLASLLNLGIPCKIYFS